MRVRERFRPDEFVQLDLAYLLRELRYELLDRRPFNAGRLWLLLHVPRELA